MAGYRLSRNAWGTAEAGSHSDPCFKDMLNSLRLQPAFQRHPSQNAADWNLPRHGPAWNCWVLHRHKPETGSWENQNSQWAYLLLPTVVIFELNWLKGQSTNQFSYLSVYHRYTSAPLFFWLKNTSPWNK